MYNDRRGPPFMKDFLGHLDSIHPNIAEKSQGAQTAYEAFAKDTTESVTKKDPALWEDGWSRMNRVRGVVIWCKR